MIEEWVFFLPFVFRSLRVWGGVMTVWPANDHVESENTETRLKKREERKK